MTEQLLLTRHDVHAYELRRVLVEVVAALLHLGMMHHLQLPTCPSPRQPRTTMHTTSLPQTGTSLEEKPSSTRLATEHGPPLCRSSHPSAPACPWPAPAARCNAARCMVSHHWCGIRRPRRAYGTALHCTARHGTEAAREPCSRRTDPDTSKPVNSNNPPEAGYCFGPSTTSESSPTAPGTGVEFGLYRRYVHTLDGTASAWCTGASAKMKFENLHRRGGRERGRGEVAAAACSISGGSTQRCRG